MIQVPVLVWGGGIGGLCAAVQCARRGVRTLLLTPGGWLGGMVSAAGVCAPDGNELSPWQSGMWGAFLRALAASEPQGLDHNWVSCFGYRPATAERVLRQWLEALPLLSWWPGCSLRALERSADRITALVIERAAETHRLEPQLVIDGSDRGDLLAHGIQHRLGWEAREQWQEPSAPPQAELLSRPFFGQQPLQSPTWVAIGQLTAERPTYRQDQGQPIGNAAGELPEPFRLASERFGLERMLTYGRLPGGLVMLNWPLHGNDWHWGLERGFGPDPQAAAELDRQMQEHSLAFADALAEASGGWLRRAAVFPDPLERELAAQRGQPLPLGGSSPLALMPYWREGRRLVGLSTVVEADLLPMGAGASIAPAPLRSGLNDAIAVGNYANDHHYPGPDWPLAAKSCRWGGRWTGTPFCIPYGALVSTDCCNLLAADKAIATSHIANGATRLQPLVMNVGQAAGLAAALCLQLGCRPAELPVGQLQRALVLDPIAPAGPMPLWDTPWHHPQWRQRQLQALADASLVNGQGQLAGAAAADPTAAPAEVGERLFRGTLLQAAQGGLLLEGSDGSWPLITLEPGLEGWIQAQSLPRTVALIGCLNPWGPWIRASRLLEPS